MKFFTSLFVASTLIFSASAFSKDFGYNPNTEWPRIYKTKYAIEDRLSTYNIQPSKDCKFFGKLAQDLIIRYQRREDLIPVFHKFEKMEFNQPELNMIKDFNQFFIINIIDTQVVGQTDVEKLSIVNAYTSYGYNFCISKANPY